MARSTHLKLDGTVVMHLDIRAGIAAIESSIREAQLSCDSYHSHHREGSDLDHIAYYVERAFVELLVLADALKLDSTHKVVAAAYEVARANGFGKTDQCDGEFYPSWAEKITTITDAIASAHGVAKTSVSELKDLKAILKRAVYAICDLALFPDQPKNEADVHRRLEAILKVHYPDLRSKPSLSKPIKNFEPDTGIPTAKTLLEYKFISTKADAKRVTDEILADASGYRSRDWTNLLFVIYETKRVQSEEDWQNLLEECQLRDGYDVVVLSGTDVGGASSRPR